MFKKIRDLFSLERRIRDEFAAQYVQLATAMKMGAEHQGTINTQLFNVIDRKDGELRQRLDRIEGATSEQLANYDTLIRGRNASAAKETQK